MIVLIDNYDSFTYNLYQYLSELGAEVRVIRNDAATVAELELMNPDGLVVSPGPGEPESAGISMDAIATFAGKVPVLGVCLGHQCIGRVYGASIVRAPDLRHGKTSEIFHTGKGVFSGLPNPFPATRYHSLIVDPATCPRELDVTAWTADGLIMGMRHRTLAVEGVQFHPESMLTRSGKALLDNFLGQVARPARPTPTPTKSS
ncbi:MAG: aminodeoxychorismate/anthranilate synthase component II [Chloroflexota bacterium]|nr:aminodeoxychorismate/anthranilate synthase component II [Chloroflexota bacterium]